MSAVLLVGLFAPLAAVVALVLGTPVRLTARMAAVVTLASAAVLAFGYDSSASGFQFISEGQPLELSNFFQIQFAVGLDGVSLALFLLTAVVGFSALHINPGTIQREREFYISLLLILFGALGAFSSLDLFYLYIFHEVALIPTFLLMGVWGTGDKRFSATQLALYLIAGSLVLLGGLFAFYFSMPEMVRTFDLRQMQDAISANDQAIAFPLLLVGFGILVSLFPFHSWAPPAYAAAPAPVTMLHAGVLKKFGIYGLLRLAVPYLPEGMRDWAVLMAVLLLMNIIFVGWVTLHQRKLDLMLGYSSVMHMGYLFLGLFSLHQLGLQGVVLLMVGHGLSTALLFGLAGEIRNRAGTVKFEALGGLATQAPGLAFLFIMGALASIGVPGLANFSGEVLIFFGAWGAGHEWMTAIAVWGIVLSAVYMLRAVRALCYGPVSESVKGVADLTGWRERFPYWLIAAGLLAVGIGPKWIIEWCRGVLGG
jgi:NADH-quinone oxidoreductase subunit M